MKEQANRLHNQFRKNNPFFIEMSQTKELIVLADELIEVVRQSVVDWRKRVAVKTTAKIKLHVSQGQRHKDLAKIQGPLLPIHYGVVSPVEIHSSIS